MKRLFNLIIAWAMLLGALPAMAQSGMSVESFSMDERDMEARAVSPKRDQNGFTAALIKIQTSERELDFEAGMMGIVATDFSQVGEVWVYVPKGIIRMKIKHNIFGVLEYEFPLPINEATVYNMKLTSKKIISFQEQDAEGQYLRLTTSPAEVEIAIDGNPPQAIMGGEGSIFLPYGDHTYTVKSNLYKTDAGRITVGDSPIDLRINLEPNFGFLDINSTPSGANVEINDMLVGTTPYKSDRLLLGDYKVRVTMPNHDPVNKTVSLTEGEKRVTETYPLASYFSQISLNCAMSGVEIYINSQLKGTDRWSGDLLPGTYEVKATKDGHRASVRQLVVERNKPQTVTLDAPTPMYGKLNVNAEMGTMVSIDGVVLGSAPNIFSNILAGKRRLVVSKSGYVPAETTITIEEGKVTNHTQAPLMSVEESEEYKAAKAKAEAETRAAEAKARAEKEAKEAKARAEKAERDRWKNDFTHAWGVGLADLDFASGAFSYTLPMLNLSFGTYENSVCFGTGFHYRLLSGSGLHSDTDYLYVPFAYDVEVYDIDSEHLPYLKAHQFVVPLYVRFNIADKARRLSYNSHPYIDLGVSINLNVGGSLKRDCEYEDGEYDKMSTIDGFSESIVNPMSMSTITKIGMISKEKSSGKEWWDLAFTIRYDLSPNYNADALNTYVTYYGNSINFYESYENVRNQIEANLYFGFSWAYFWTPKK